MVRTDFRFHCPSGASAQHGPRTSLHGVMEVVGVSFKVQIRDFPLICVGLICSILGDSEEVLICTSSKVSDMT